ncbi:hypothetical protein PDG61_16125 [Mycolicibacterium sp. BiH015]|uniref:hypothetical protein n=1 Tax=Mycolicibacterium sp. BiH015 TaxID=3018808 RepID=UPI0022DF5617|nr:hypothetical protein [Mycolicibacterium sp. BiH015]MDA2892448.1 hypothetical protein [Mycolicibacterium sp. BiH015]
MSSPVPALADVLGRYAAATGAPRLSAVEARLRAPLAVAVVGRPGVGRGAVARALTGAGVTVVSDAADVGVVVVAETLKPEDRRALRGDLPSMVVLNKADLSGRVVGGPLAAARRDADDLAVAVGRPVVPMIAHLADVELDGELVDALRTLATEPADMTSTDAFVGSDHAVPAPIRRRLLERLDRFGLAHAVLAVVEGAAADAVAVRLRGLSHTEAVVERLAGFAAEVGYRRTRAALLALERAATESRDDDLAAFLAGDEVVIAVMAAAVGLVEASGLRVDPGDDPDTHLRRAVRWRRYADGPLDVLHRRCAADISRGSLRLLGQAR